ncbi:MAG TPA: hypothetical protein VFQ42_22050 [Mycobacterium sp.]|nr:hypothetical protein [Mycobacterium sp.]
MKVVVQLVREDTDPMRAGLRLIIDGAVVDTGEFGGEPEDNGECRDYKWVKEMLMLLAKRLGAEATLEVVEVKSDDRGYRSIAYYEAMAAPYTGGAP